MEKVAVYGTLREGCSNHLLMADSALLGEDSINGFEMFSAGGFPVVYHTDNDDSIVVEVYDVEEQRLKGQLDSLEGHPTWYKRERVKTAYGYAWLYVMQDVCYKRGNKIESGDWRLK